jgi:hypothetical protein
MKSMVDQALEAPFTQGAKKWYQLIFVLVAVIMLGGLLFYQATVVEISKYFLFHALYILMPGLFVYKALKFDGDFVERMVFAFGIGITLVIVEYLVFYMINWRIGLYVLNPLLALALLISSFPQIKKRDFGKGSIPFEVWGVVALLTLIAFLGMTLNAPGPELAGSMSYHQDKLWSTGIIQALITQFPPIDVHISGHELKYHYFSFIYMSVISIITKIDPMDVYFKFSQILKPLFLALSVYYLGQVIFSDKKKAFYFTFIYFFSNCASLFFAFRVDAGYFRNANLYHFTEFPNGYMLAMTYFFICCALVIKQIRLKKFHWSYFLAFTIFTFALTGSKAPVAAMLVGGVNLTFCGYFLLYRKLNKPLLAYFLVLNSIFIGVYLFLYSYSVGETMMAPKIQLASLTREIYLLKDIVKFLTNNALVSTILYVLLIPVQLFLFLPFASVPYLASLAETVQSRKISEEKLFYVSTATLGIFLSNFVYFPLGGQSYFIFISIAFIEVLALKYLYENYKVMSGFFRSFVAATFVLSILSTGFIVLRQTAKAAKGVANAVIPKRPCSLSNDIKKEQLTGLKKLLNKAVPSDDCPGWNRITKYEHEGLIWLKNNTPENSLVATDRLFYAVPPPNSFVGSYARYFYYSSFSNRKMFLEGFFYWCPVSLSDYKRKVVDQLYTSKLNDRADIMKEHKIDYMIVSRFLYPNLKVNDIGLSLVYETRDMKIYKRE